MAPSQTSLTFTVRRRGPELISPIKPTPHEFKQLSDIDDHDTFRFHIPVVNIYKYDPSLQMQGKDPVSVIRKALAKVLFFYYPFAGRLREGPGRKLVVECTGEGILFIEADADVTLEEFAGHAPSPPFPCMDELLYNIPGSDGVLNCPLLLIQVTRLKCGGFIFGIRMNHTMADAFGLLQFMKATSELIHGASKPSIIPVWQRSILNARDPPRITRTHHEFGKHGDCFIPFTGKVTVRSIFFGPKEISTLRRLLPPHLRKSSNFEVVVSVVWRCRTYALQMDPEEDTSLMILISARSLKPSFPIPIGYYGNAFVYPAAVTTVRDLCKKPLGYAVELVKKAKASVTEEYFRSVVDFLAIKGRPPGKLVRSYYISDLTRFEFKDVDFGWGKATFAGVPMNGRGFVPEIVNFFSSFKSGEGEGIVVPVFLPELAMELFEKELSGFLINHHGTDHIRAKL